MMEADEIHLLFRCSLCHASSDDILIMTGVYAGKQMLLCLDCIAEATAESNREVKNEEEK